MSPSERCWTIIGNPDCRRVAFFQKALAEHEEPPATFVSYADLLNRRVDLREHLSPGSIVRLESAAELWTTRQQLLKHGIEPALAEGYTAADPEQIGQIVGPNAPEFKPRQLYLGFCRLLREIELAIKDCSAITISSPNNIICMYDKLTCQQRLTSFGVPIPSIITVPKTYDDMRAACGNKGRFMLKMSHGSGGVGCVALHFSQGRVRAITSSQTLAMIDHQYADAHMPIQHLDDEVVIAQLIDSLCKEQAHVEAWLPKARLEGQPFDLRVVVIAGKPCHAIARLGRSPFTNLNLGGTRRSISLLLQHVGESVWHDVERISENVASCFPESLYMGVDYLLRPNGNLHVLEINAFGDLLLNVHHEGHDPYSAEIATMKGWHS